MKIVSLAVSPPSGCGVAPMLAQHPCSMIPRYSRNCTGVTTVVIERENVCAGSVLGKGLFWGSGSSPFRPLAEAWRLRPGPALRSTEWLR